MWPAHVDATARSVESGHVNNTAICTRRMATRHTTYSVESDRAVKSIQNASNALGRFARLTLTVRIDLEPIFANSNHFWQRCIPTRRTAMPAITSN